MIDEARLAATLAERVAGPAFGIPGGGRVLTLIDQLESGGVGFQTTHFEGSGALMAGALGRLTGRPGLAMSIKGPGLANLAAGLATCRLEAMPVIAVGEAYGTDADPSRHHKRLDHRGLAHSVCKSSVGLDAGAEAVIDLLDDATREIPGPVLLELARTGRAEGNAEVGIAPAGDLRAAVASARRPVLVVGSLAIRLGLAPALARATVPVFTTAAAKGAIDERLPHAAGVFTGVGRTLAPEVDVLAAADLVVGIGLRAEEILSLDGIPCPLVSIEAAPLRASDRYAAVGTPDMVDEVLGALAGSEWGMEEVAEAQARMRTALLDAPFLPAHCFAALEERFGAEMRTVLDTGHFCTVGEHLARVDRPERYLSTGSGRSMGSALPFAVAGALHDPEVPTVLAIGDGGIGMYFSELRIAVQRALPLLVLFLSDGAFGSIRSAAVARGLTERPLVMDPSGWRAAADGLGMWTASAGDERGLGDALAEWRASEGPGFLEVRFPADTYRDMTDELRG